MYNISFRSMKKNILIIAFLLGSVILPTLAQKQEKTITIEVHNNWNQPQTDAPVVISLRELQMGFKVKSAVVMEGSDEIPSQLDDLNRDRKMDELAFVTELPAQGRKTFQITLSSEKSTKTVIRWATRLSGLFSMEATTIRRLTGYTNSSRW